MEESVNKNLMKGRNSEKKLIGTESSWEELVESIGKKINWKETEKKWERTGKEVRIIWMEAVKELVESIKNWEATEKGVGKDSNKNSFINFLPVSKFRYTFFHQFLSSKYSRNFNSSFSIPASLFTVHSHASYLCFHKFLSVNPSLSFFLIPYKCHLVPSQFVHTVPA